MDIPWACPRCCIHGMLSAVQDPHCIAFSIQTLWGATLWMISHGQEGWKWGRPIHYL